MHRPEKSSQAPRLPAVVRIQVWLCVAWMAFAGLLSVSPALHDLFCTHVHARTSPACLAHDSCDGHNESPAEHASGEHRCAVTYFQTGFDFPMPTSGVLAFAAVRSTPPAPASALTPFEAPRGLHPPGNAPPLRAA